MDHGNIGHENIGQITIALDKPLTIVPGEPALMRPIPLPQCGYGIGEEDWGARVEHPSRTHLIQHTAIGIVGGAARYSCL